MIKPTQKKGKVIYQILTKVIKRVGKRRRFIFGSIFMTLIFIMTSFLNFASARFFILPVMAASYFISFFAILEDISGIEWLMLFLLPVFFTATFYTFYFFFPGRWLTRLPYSIIYAVSIYAIMLCSNILNVRTNTPLALFRAAFSINYLFLTVTCFLVFNIILSLKLNFVFNFVLFMGVLFPLGLQFVWSVNPRSHLQRELIGLGLIIALIIAEIATIFSFMPIKPVILALLLTAGFYSLCGLFQAHLENRLFRERIREYLFVLIFVFLVAMLTVRWQ